MSIADLSDVEARQLLLMPKVPIEADKQWNFPELGQKITIDLQSTDASERFILIANKSSYNIEKVSYLTRSRRLFILARLDMDPNGRHMNPDGNWLTGPQFHEYREGFNDRWANPVPPNLFPDVLNRADCWDRFLKYCNVLKYPDVRFTLFS